MKIDHKYLQDLHIDSTAAIAQAGVLGDSFVDIDSTHAAGPAPRNNSELKSSDIPRIQDVIRTSQVSIEEAQSADSQDRDPDGFAQHEQGHGGRAYQRSADGEKDLRRSPATCKRSRRPFRQDRDPSGKMVNDDTMYTRMNTALDHIEQHCRPQIDSGQGSAGKLLKDNALYDNLNSAVTNANQLVTEDQLRQGRTGQARPTTPRFAQKLDNTSSRSRRRCSRA